METAHSVRSFGGCAWPALLPLNFVTDYCGRELISPRAGHVRIFGHLPFMILPQYTQLQELFGRAFCPSFSPPAKDQTGLVRHRVRIDPRMAI
jgi:hypothetical protein